MSPRSTAARVGALRPSQLLHTFGIGSIVDLPKLSVMIMGLDDWDTDESAEISEPRLVAAVQRQLGSQVRRLLAPPIPEEVEGVSPSPFDEKAGVGVPVAPFPRWLVCPACRLLAPIRSGLFELKQDFYRPERTRYVHGSCNKMSNPEAIPARFVLACENGHLDDFPWLDFVHQGPACDAPELRLIETGVSGEAVDVRVECRRCGASQTMARAFQRQGSQGSFPCSGRRPQLRDFDPKGCDRQARTMLLGASNQWFAVSLTALSLPTGRDKLGRLVEENWAVLGKAENLQNVALFREIGQLRGFSEFSDEEIWREVQRRKDGDGGQQETSDLKAPEWKVFSRPREAPQSDNFRLSEAGVPKGFEEYLDQVVLVERLREVRALTGFSRIASLADYDVSNGAGPARAPLARSAPRWVPACEIRGEGVFMRFNEEKVADWVRRCSVLASEFLAAHQAWRKRRGLEPNLGFPSIRFVLLHSFSPRADPAIGSRMRIRHGEHPREDLLSRRGRRRRPDGRRTPIHRGP